MNYEESVKFLAKIHKFSLEDAFGQGEPFSLTAIKELMANLNNPQDDLNIVHVAGTNGKGSTVAYLSNILIKSNLKTGTFTSPFIKDYREMIKINNEIIPKDEFAKIITKIAQICQKMVLNDKKPPSQFEALCACAFMYFASKNCDIVVIEVGLGGKVDATNIIKNPKLCIFTPISLEHHQILGNSVGKISKEKSGIIKENCKVLTCNQLSEAMDEIKYGCKEKKASLSIANTPEYSKNFCMKSQSFDMPGDENLKNIVTSLIGTYQIDNAALAIKAALILSKEFKSITYDSIKSGIKSTYWQGRFEILNDKPYVVLDAAHNLEGVNALYESLERYFPNKKISFVVGVMADKNYEMMMKKIIPISKKFYTITISSPRSLKARTLRDIIREHGGISEDFDNIDSALKMALYEAEDDDIICVFGSIYYIADVKKFFHKVKLTMAI